MMSRRAAMVSVLAAMALLAVAFVTGTAPSAVDWGTLRAVVLESDDWGLAGFVPDAAAWEDLDRDALTPGRFPAVYWGSTLEDAAAVTELATALLSVGDRHGRPAVFQPNYVLFSMAADHGEWVRHALPDVPAEYRRPGMWEAVNRAVAAGVWYPEFHGSWHYDPAARRAHALDPGAPATATGRGIMLFPGSEGARELGPERERDALAAELDASLDHFQRLFGRSVGSVIAPDYTWDARMEGLWAERGLLVIQAKREQRDPGLPRGRAGRALKYLGRRRDVLRHVDRVYLERNCRYEPAQSPDPDATLAVCLGAVEEAWRRGEPAIVETHRVNFVHTDTTLAAAGRRGLSHLLETLAARRPGPLFLSDHEVAQLARRGTSTAARGGAVVLHNGSRSRRLVTVPESELSLARRLAGLPHRLEEPRVVALPAGGSADLVPGPDGWKLLVRRSLGEI